MRRLGPAVVAAALALAPAGLGAQTSVYSVLGVGTPGHALGVRARALGGGIAAVDAGSALNPAAVMGLGQLTAVATTTSSWRRFEADGTTVEGLEDTRFLFAMVGGPILGSPLAFAVSYATYADRTYDLRVSDALVIRGSPTDVQYRLASIGAIADVRGALGWQPTATVRLGLGVHLLSGTTRETVTGTFGDTLYFSHSQQSEAEYSGAGLSVGIVTAPAGWLRAGAALRTDTRLEAEGSLLPAGTIDLPVTLSGGVVLALRPSLRWSASGVWRSWSAANDDLPASGSVATAFDTWEIGSGIELGDVSAASAQIPLRAGFRYGTLPFSPSDDQPRELAITAGSGIRVARGRGAIELALERVYRDGAGVAERVWQAHLAITVRP